MSKYQATFRVQIMEGVDLFTETRFPAMSGDYLVRITNDNAPYENEFEFKGIVKQEMIGDFIVRGMKEIRKMIESDEGSKPSEGEK